MCVVSKGPVSLNIQRQSFISINRPFFPSNFYHQNVHTDLGRLLSSQGPAVTSRRDKSSGCQHLRKNPDTLTHVYNFSSEATEAGGWLELATQLDFPSQNRKSPGALRDLSQIRNGLEYRNEDI